MSARPFVQATRSTGFPSVLFVGFDIGKMTGRSTCFAISRTTASVNVSGSPEVPIRTVGFTARTTARRSRDEPFLRPIFAARAAGHANSRLWTSLISSSSTTRPLLSRFAMARVRFSPWRPARRNVSRSSRAMPTPAAPAPRMTTRWSLRGIPVARLLRDTFRRAGLEGENLIRAIANLDSQGLVVGDGEIKDVHKRDFAWPAALAEKMGLKKGSPRDLLAVVRAVKPTVLIGTSAQPGTFTEAIVREMAKHVERPVIFPMSNPTSKCEAKPVDLVAWTNGRALIATGSPFDPVPYQGRMITIGQGNNVFIFPGVGLGALVAEAKEVTDGMFAVAAQRLADEVKASDLASGSLFPSAHEIRRISARIAEDFVAEARNAGVGRKISDAEIPKAVAAMIWDPAYLPMVPVPTRAEMPALQSV